MARILYIEDEQGPREGTARLFTLLGHEVDAAINTTEAKAHFAANTPDIVISDYDLRDMRTGETGMDFISWIRQQTEKGGDRIPVVLLTTTHLGEIKDRYRDFDELNIVPMEKPLQLNLLAPILNELPTQGPAGSRGRGHAA